MKPILFILTLLITSFSQCQNFQSVDFSLIIGDCFHNDTVTILINDIKILNSINATSDPSTGITNFAFFQDEDSLHIENYKVKSINRINITKYFRINIIINRTFTQSIQIDLQKGKFIVLDYCLTKNTSAEKYKSISVSQYIKPVEFE